MKENNEIVFLVGNNETINCDELTKKPFDDCVINFLDALSKYLLKNTSREFPDVISFAFWCRKSNILNQKNQVLDNFIRKGRGVVFHIAPSNVPVNFAFSLAFSLLAGNLNNIVKVSSKEYEQVKIICDAINFVIKDFEEIKKATSVIKYPNIDEITAELSKMADVRVIWGGDGTVRYIKSLETKPRSEDIVFADRFSLCVIKSEAIVNLPSDKLLELSNNFYNDTFLMDQNACSSPHLILFYGDAAVSKKAQNILWKAISDFIKNKYNIQPISVVDKLTKSYSYAIEHTCQINSADKKLFLIDIDSVPKDIEDLRGNCGFFFQTIIENFADLKNYVNKKYQTLTYYGFEKETLYSHLKDEQLTGIDRIVPVGKAMDIGLIWDGYNLINSLSRIINIV